jgi:prepilin peptidase CpaA
MLLISLLLLAVATIYDLKSRTIPDWIAVAMLGWSFVATVAGFAGTSWTGLGTGLLMGFGLGAGLFWLGALGGGDAKLIAALGAALGPVALLGVLFWMAIVGGLLALVAKWRGRQDLAYVPAIAAGLLIYSIRIGEWAPVL